MFLHTCGREQRANAAKYAVSPKRSFTLERKSSPPSTTKPNTGRSGQNMYLEENDHRRSPGSPDPWFRTVRFTGRIRPHLRPALTLQKEFHFSRLLKATTCIGSQCGNLFTYEKWIYFKMREKTLKLHSSMSCITAVLLMWNHCVLMVAAKALRTYMGEWPPQGAMESHTIFEKHGEGSKLTAINYSWINRLARGPADVLEVGSSPPSWPVLGAPGMTAEFWPGSLAYEEDTWTWAIQAVRSDSGLSPPVNYNKSKMQQSHGFHLKTMDQFCTVPAPEPSIPEQS